MIFNFRIVSDEVDNFKREIQIDSTATFLDLKRPYAKVSVVTTLDEFLLPLRPQLGKGKK